MRASCSGRSRPIRRRFRRRRTAIVGTRLDDTAIGAAADAAYRPAKPMDNTDFTLGWRKEMVRVHVQRALQDIRAQSA